MIIKFNDRFNRQYLVEKKKSTIRCVLFDGLLYDKYPNKLGSFFNEELPVKISICGLISTVRVATNDSIIIIETYIDGITGIFQDSREITRFELSLLEI